MGYWKAGRGDGGRGHTAGDRVPGVFHPAARGERAGRLSRWTGAFLNLHTLPRRLVVVVQRKTVSKKS